MALNDKELESIFNNPQLIEEKKFGYVVYSGRNLRIDHGVFATEAAALAWAERADRWRGLYHPLTPHLVEPIQLEPLPFPDV